MTKRKDDAQTILDGSWLSAYKSQRLGLDQTRIEYWGSVVGVQSAVDEIPVPREECNDYGLTELLSSTDVGDALLYAGGTSPGSDKVAVADCKSLELTVITELFILMLALECPPASLVTARLKLVPK
ncbi:unnamed protein product [Dicrocoelium dendriticum]|nr:unnamed protein product [Dicrocoelium dendriticum]